MSYNKFGEKELAHIVHEGEDYYISRDRAGQHVLREDNTNGSEIFSPIKDDGRKNTKHGRVNNVSLLYRIIDG